MNKCVTCQETFDSWVSYNEHMAFSHWETKSMSQSPFEAEEALESQDSGLLTHSSGRTDLGKQAYRGPMDKAVKAAVVKRVETRLGLQHFFGLMLLGLFLLPLAAQADDDGHGDDGGIIGPAGPAGPIGPTGRTGQTGAQGVAGTNTSVSYRGTDVIGGIAVRLYDHKYFQIQAFDDYVFGGPQSDVFGGGHNQAVGARVVFKLGRSWEEELLNKQAAQLTALEAQLSRLQK